MEQISDKPLWTSIDDVKTYSRINHDCEDSLLELMIATAEQLILQVLGCNYERLIDVYGVLPPPIRFATLKLVDTYYQRYGIVQPQQMYVVPYDLEMNLWPFIQKI